MKSGMQPSCSSLGMPSSKTAVHHRHANERAEGLGETVVAPARPRLHYLRQNCALLVLPRAWLKVGVGGEHPGEPLVGAPCAAYGVMVSSSGASCMLPLSVCSSMTSHHCPRATAD